MLAVLSLKHLLFHKSNRFLLVVHVHVPVIAAVGVLEDAVSMWVTGKISTDVKIASYRPESEQVRFAPVSFEFFPVPVAATG